MKSGAEWIANILTTDDMRDRVHEVLRLLTIREENVLRLFYGIGTEPQSLTAIAARYGLPKKRIIATRKKAIQKFKNRWVL